MPVLSGDDLIRRARESRPDLTAERFVPDPLATERGLTRAHRRGIGLQAPHPVGVAGKGGGEKSETGVEIHRAIARIGVRSALLVTFMGLVLGVCAAIPTYWLARRRSEGVAE